MMELEVSFSEDSPQERGKEIKISVNNSDKNYVYKFSAGLEGIWSTLKEYSEEDYCLWQPEKDGKYTLMIQGKNRESNRPFDGFVRVDYIIGSVEEQLISNLALEKEELVIGEKLNLFVEASHKPVMFKYWISGSDGWELIKDYTKDNELFYTVNEPGKHEILIECKSIESKNNFDDFKTVAFYVSEMTKVEIKDFKCLTKELLVDEELIFQVEASHEDSRMVLYKFIKIDSMGRALCLQDYSSKRMITYREDSAGDYKLLCMAKDIYSPKEYDDRALITYSIMAYRPIKIKNFTTDFLSPQTIGTKVLLKAVVEGGKELLYRYKIDGSYSEDSGFVRNNSYLWETRTPGDYKLTLFVKDKNSSEEYEETATFDYLIEEKAIKAVKIRDVVLSREKNYVKDKPINISVHADGGTELRYAFIMYKDNEEVEKINFGISNWVNFTPNEAGDYQLEIRVKDKYSLKEYDSHTYSYFKVNSYERAAIDYVLMPAKEYYMVEEPIELEVVSRNTSEVVFKYSVAINDHPVEETKYGMEDKYSFIPKVSGKYTFTIYSKNIDCTDAFDEKKEIKMYIHDALPVTGTKIKASSVPFQKNKEISFTAQSEGGKDVCYEFYLMENKEWRLMQRYSRKRYYSFIPFIKGDYKLLVLSRSFYKKVAYEDYDILNFKVN